MLELMFHKNFRLKHKKSVKQKLAKYLHQEKLTAAFQDLVGLLLVPSILQYLVLSIGYH